MQTLGISLAIFHTVPGHSGASRVYLGAFGGLCDLALGARDTDRRAVQICGSVEQARETVRQRRATSAGAARQRQQNLTCAEHFNERSGDRHEHSDSDRQP